MQQPEQIPPGATAIDIDSLFAAMGELFYQVRELRKVIGQQQQQQASRNGAVDAIQLER